ncbi:MAG: hypothetical protein V4724_02125 [Pseudomonadota bacterium]
MSRAEMDALRAGTTRHRPSGVLVMFIMRGSKKFEGGRRLYAGVRLVPVASGVRARIAGNANRFQARSFNQRRSGCRATPSLVAAPEPGLLCVVL